MPATPSLDGLRAVAIVVVALFHFPTHAVVVGGLIGVGVFFVLSGFLVTSLLTSEYSQRDTIVLRRFAGRRAWRLLPALLAFLAVFVVADAAFGSTPWFASTPFGRGAGRPVTLVQAVTGVGASITYTFNFFLAHSVHMASPLGHLWTLSVEGQFYLLWALVVLVLVRRGPRALFAGTLAMAAASALLPFLWWHGGSGENLIYFATLPRLQQLLAGSALAQLWSLGKLRRLPGWLLRGGAVAGAGVLGVLAFEMGNTQFKYLGSFTVVAAASCPIVVCLVAARGRCIGRQLLGSRPLVWLGRRSYAMYLWHWPLAEWTNLMPHAIGIPLGLALSVVAADLSWRLVEQPSLRLSRRLAEQRMASRSTRPSPATWPPARP